MRILKQKSEDGSVLLCVLCTILIVSLIGANVLSNCITRSNAASGQVRGWKESIYAAEAGGDLAYAEIRKTVFDPAHAFSGWTNAGGIYSNSPPAFGRNNLTTSATVDVFYTDSSSNPWYRIRVKGIAPVLGLTRVTMDDRISPGTRGDSLLRKIDFKYDHFIAAYGPKGDNVGKGIVPVSRPQIARRIELIAAPVTPFDAAIRVVSSFNGPGSAGWVDSYSSINGNYKFLADQPLDPNYKDSHSGAVAVGSASFNLGRGPKLGGPIWGNVTTNGGNVTSSDNPGGLGYISEKSIDNNVPFTVPPYVMPTNLPLPLPALTTITGNVTLDPSTAGSPSSPNFYVVTSFSGKLTINPASDAGPSVQTYVAIHATSNITGSIDVKPNVHVQIFFDGNISVKAQDLVNESGLAANLQFYGISPTDPATTQSIDIASPGNFSATFYAPSADFHIDGNPDVTGAIVCKTFYENGNASWHYDRALAAEGERIDYRIVSYVEDMR